jgi:hypothetical protein
MRIFAIIAACVVTLALAPVAAARDVAMPVRVRAGDQFTVTVTDRNSFGAGEQQIGFATTVVWALDVLEAGRSGGRWRWTPVSVHFDSIPRVAGVDEEGDAEAALASLDPEALSEGMSAFLRIAADIGFECRVDSTGRCLALSNWPAWRSRYENAALMIDAFARMAQTSEAREAQADGPGRRGRSSGAKSPLPTTVQRDVDWGVFRGPVLQSLAAVIDGVDERAAAFAMAGLHPLSALQGRTLAVGRASPFVEEWAMPFGASPIRVSGATTLESVTGGVAIVRRQAELDGESARAAVRAAASYLVESVMTPLTALSSGRADAPDAAVLRAGLDAFTPLLDVSFSETTRGEVELRSGLARAAVTEYRWRLALPRMGGGGAARKASAATEDEGAAITGSGSYTIRLTPGAPATPRLPRPNDPPNRK